MDKTISKYFITTALAFLFLGCIEGVMMPTKFLFKDVFISLFNLPPDQIKSFFGYFVTKIHTHINLIGWVGSAVMGVLYLAAPQISGRECYIKWAAYLSWALNTLGVLVITVSFHLIGVYGLRSGYEVGSPQFRAVGAPFRHMVAVGGVMVLTASVLFAWNILKTMYASGSKE